MSTQAQQLDLPNTRRAAPKPVRTKVEWTTRELAILREHYPQGGVAACIASLPQRTECAIYAKAIATKLTPPRKSLPRRKPYAITAQIDDAITRLYLNGLRKGQMQVVSKQIGRPDWWIKTRAAKLGISTPRLMPEDWAEEEIAILEAEAHHASSTIARKLRARGYRRTHCAIASKISRLGYSREDPNRWSTGYLARMCGVDQSVVRRWIEAHGLPASRPSGSATVWTITRTGFRRWIADNAHLVDIRRIDKYWFFDLAFGRSQ